MWFKMPKGVNGVTVERQAFVKEVMDEDGRGYFRAPNHFAGIIINLLGMEASVPPAGCDLEDLPLADPLRDGAIADLGLKVENQSKEMEILRTDLNAARAQITSLMNENKQLLSQLHAANVTIDELKEEISDGPSLPLTTPEKVPLRTK